MSVITEGFDDLANAMNDVRAMFNKMRGTIKNVGADLFARNLNIMLPVVKGFMALKSVLGKVQASMVAAVYTLYGAYITLDSFFEFTYELIINIMWTIVGTIIGLFAVGWIFHPLLLDWLLLLFLLFISLSCSNDCNHEQYQCCRYETPPPVPGYCFDEDTGIVMKNGRKTKIKNIKVGDVLHDGR